MNKAGFTTHTLVPGIFLANKFLGAVTFFRVFVTQLYCFSVFLN